MNAFLMFACTFSVCIISWKRRFEKNHSVKSAAQWSHFFSDFIDRYLGFISSLTKHWSRWTSLLSFTCLRITADVSIIWCGAHRWTVGGIELMHRSQDLLAYSYRPLNFTPAFELTAVSYFAGKHNSKFLKIAMFQISFQCAFRWGPLPPGGL